MTADGPLLLVPIALDEVSERAIASLVAMATRAHPGPDLALHASTAMRVVHRSPSPVLLLRVPS
jgi:nucleotide-binding universal stress UspA family protein